MSPSTAPANDLSQPIFTRAALLAIEDHMQQVASREQAQRPVPVPNNNPTEVPTVVFHGEKAQAIRDGKQGEFACVTPGTMPLVAQPVRSAEETNDRWQQLDALWEQGHPERPYLRDLVRRRPQAVARVDKIFGFGLGPVCAGPTRSPQPGVAFLPDLHLWEHLTLLSLADDISRLKNNGRRVTVYAADPGYTPNCKRVLAAVGVQIIEGFGARGFTMVDDTSLVVTKYPSFPVREILADLCRPVAFVGNRQRTRTEVAAMGAYARAQTGDPDSERTRRMFDDDYEEGQELQASVFKNQWWHWRKR